MKKPKWFRNMTDRQYRAFIIFFVLPVSIYLLGRLIILVVLFFF